jgi:hypothetical protein
MAEEIVQRRHLKLTKAERDAKKKQKQLEHLASLFLDLDTHRTNQQIADEMGLSLPAMKRLTQDPEFQAIYDDVLMNLGHHPRLQVLSASLPELGVASFKALDEILRNPRASATARVAAAKLVWDSLHIADSRADEDPGAINKFLGDKGINVQANTVNINLPIPDEYKEAFARLMGADIVDARVTDVPELPAESEE